MEVRTLHPSARRPNSARSRLETRPYAARTRPSSARSSSKVIYTGQFTSSFDQPAKTTRPSSARSYSRRSLPSNPIVGLNISEPTAKLLHELTHPPTNVAPIPAYAQIAPVYTAPVKKQLHARAFATATSLSPRLAAHQALLARVLAMPFTGGLTEEGVEALAAQRARDPYNTGMRMPRTPQEKAAHEQQLFDEAATATRSVQEQEWLENAAPLTADEIRSTSRAAQSIADLLEEAESALEEPAESSQHKGTAWGTRALGGVVAARAAKKLSKHHMKQRQAQHSLLLQKAGQHVMSALSTIGLAEPEEREPEYDVATDGIKETPYRLSAYVPPEPEKEEEEEEGEAPAAAEITTADAVKVDEEPEEVPMEDAAAAAAAAEPEAAPQKKPAAFDYSRINARRPALTPQQALAVNHVMRRACASDPYDRDPPAPLRPRKAIQLPRPVPDKPSKALVGYVPQQSKWEVHEAARKKEVTEAKSRKPPTPSPPPQSPDSAPSSSDEDEEEEIGEDEDEEEGLSPSSSSKSPPGHSPSSRRSAARSAAKPLQEGDKLNPYARPASPPVRIPSPVPSRIAAANAPAAAAAAGSGEGSPLPSYARGKASSPPPPRLASPPRIASPAAAAPAASASSVATPLFTAPARAQTTKGFATGAGTSIRAAAPPPAANSPVRPYSAVVTVRTASRERTPEPPIVEPPATDGNNRPRSSPGQRTSPTPRLAVVSDDTNSVPVEVPLPPSSPTTPGQPVPGSRPVPVQQAALHAVSHDTAMEPRPRPLHASELIGMTRHGAQPRPGSAIHRGAPRTPEPPDGPPTRRPATARAKATFAAAPSDSSSPQALRPSPPITFKANEPVVPWAERDDEADQEEADSLLRQARGLAETAPETPEGLRRMGGRARPQSAAAFLHGAVGGAPAAPPPARPQSGRSKAMRRADKIVMDLNARGL